MLTLWDAPKGASVTILGLKSDLHQLILNRLNEMGLEQGQTVLCLRRSPFNGPVVVAIADCVYSLEQTIASDIFIELMS
ncbi:MAG: ferrous iron transport protein A [Rheinheimera sp.]